MSDYRHRNMRAFWVFTLRMAIVLVLAALAFFYGPFVLVVRLLASAVIALILGLSVYFAVVNRRRAMNWTDNVVVAAFSVVALIGIWI